MHIINEEEVRRRAIHLAHAGGKNKVKQVSGRVLSLAEAAAAQVIEKMLIAEVACLAQTAKRL